MTDTTRDLIQAIAAGDATNTQNAFNLAMADKISAQLETLRADVAKNMFNTPESESTETVEAEEETVEAEEE
jgi:hypothetical protein